MKAVRYAIGAVGFTPALGMMLQAVNASPGVTHPPKKAVKTVSLLSHHAAPLTACGSKSKGHAIGNQLSGTDAYSGACLHSQNAYLEKAQTGLTERVRYYSGNGQLEGSNWRHGTIVSNNGRSGVTYFSSSPNLFARKVCQALVANANHKDVKYGPVCEKA